MDIWHWWFAKLVVAQILYLLSFIWVMRALTGSARFNHSVPNRSARLSKLGSPAPIQKS